MDDKTLAMRGDKEAQRRITERGELLPCPFCGGNGSVKGERAYVKWVQCERCLSETGTEETEKEAIESWNTRVFI